MDYKRLAKELIGELRQTRAELAVLKECSLCTYLDEGQWEEFETVQRFHGIETNADIMRFLLRKEARRIRGILEVRMEEEVGETTYSVAVGMDCIMNDGYCIH